METSEITASPLSDVTSRKTVKVMGLQTSVDGGGRIRVIKQKKKGVLPSGTEELRTALRVEGNLWNFLAAKYRTKIMLKGMGMQVWFDYANYLLGEKVYLMKIPTGAPGKGQSVEQVALRPPWNVILTYEQELRSEAVKKSLQEARPLAETLKEACEDSRLKEQYFTAPIALQGKAGHTSQDEPWKRSWHGQESQWGPKWQRKGGKGEWSYGGDWSYKGEQHQKGKFGHGKGKKGDKGKSTKGGALCERTPDGRQICFAFNSRAGCKGACSRVHICQVRGCHQPHPTYEHPMGNQQQATGNQQQAAN
jgi:hypothetical protein